MLTAPLGTSALSTSVIVLVGNKIAFFEIGKNMQELIAIKFRSK